MCVATLLHSINTMGPTIGTVTINTNNNGNNTSAASAFTAALIATSSPPTPSLSLNPTAPLPSSSSSTPSASANAGFATLSSLTMDQKKSLSTLSNLVRRSLSWPVRIPFDGLSQLAPLIVESVMTEYQTIRRCFSVSGTYAYCHVIAYIMI
jgi:hypothetical protein